MAANTVTYFGDVTTVGNTVVVQNLTSQGNYSIFTGNVSPKVSGSNLGSVATPWQGAYIASANVTSTNVSSILGTVGVNTPSDNATKLLISGNVYASTDLSSQNVFVTKNANVQGVLNTSSIFNSTGLLGINTTTPNANLHVLGNIYASNSVSTQFMNVTVSANIISLGLSVITGSIGINTSVQAEGLLPLVKVAGNVWASNSFQTPSGIFTNVTATRSNINSIFSPAVGVGQVPGGATLQVTGNIYASNALSAPSVLVTTANITTLNVSSLYGTSGLIGIGTTVTGATLHVSGNILVSNSTSSLIASAVTSNVPTLNVFSIAGQVGIGTSTNIGATIQVPGNVWVSNALAGKLIAPLGNVTTLNISFIYGTSTVVGFNTSVVANGPTIQFPGENIYASNTLSAQNIIVTTIQTYNEDLTRRSPHLSPSTANAVAIQNWIAASCNVTRKVGWSASPTPVYSNIIAGPVITNGYKGGVLLPDGTVMFISAGIKNVGIFNPKTYSFSAIVPSGDSIVGAYSGGVLLPNGNVCMIPQNTTSNVGLYNPVSKRFSNSGLVGGAGFDGGVLVPSGNVVMIPSTGSNIVEFNPTTLTLSNTVNMGTTGLVGGVLIPNGTVVCVPQGVSNVVVYNPATQTYSNTVATGVSVGNAVQGGVLAPNGNVIFVPLQSANVGVYNPSNATYSNVGPINSGGLVSFIGGCLLPTGNIIFSPFQSANIGMFDPVALTYSNCTNIGTPSLAGAHAGATLLPSGQVVFCPFNSNVGVLDTFTPASREFCLSPYFNKF